MAIKLSEKDLAGLEKLDTIHKYISYQASTLTSKSTGEKVNLDITERTLAEYPFTAEFRKRLNEDMKAHILEVEQIHRKSIGQMSEADDIACRVYGLAGKIIIKVVNKKAAKAGLADAAKEYSLADFYNSWHITTIGSKQLVDFPIKEMVLEYARCKTNAAMTLADDNPMHIFMPARTSKTAIEKRKASETSEEDLEIGEFLFDGVVLATEWEIFDSNKKLAEMNTAEDFMADIKPARRKTYSQRLFTAIIPSIPIKNRIPGATITLQDPQDGQEGVTLASLLKAISRDGEIPQNWKHREIFKIQQALRELDTLWYLSEDRTKWTRFISIVNIPSEEATLETRIKLHVNCPEGYRSGARFNAISMRHFSSISAAHADAYKNLILEWDKLARQKAGYYQDENSEDYSSRHLLYKRIEKDGDMAHKNKWQSNEDMIALAYGKKYAKTLTAKSNHFRKKLKTAQKVLEDISKHGDCIIKKRKNKWQIIPTQIYLNADRVLSEKSDMENQKISSQSSTQNELEFGAES